MQYCFYSIAVCFYHQSHPQLGVVFALAPSLYSFWSYFSTDLQQHTGYLPTWGVHLSVSYIFAFSYCSWSSQGKILKWFAIPFSSGPCFVRIFTSTHPSWVTLHGMAHGFIELDKAVVHVIIPIPKKGSAKECSNYRTLPSVHTPSKGK